MGNFESEVEQIMSMEYGVRRREYGECNDSRHCEKEIPRLRSGQAPQSLQGSPRSYRSLTVTTLFVFFSFFLSPLAAFAQMGPCSAEGTCPSGQTCYDPPEGDRQCFKNCTPAAASDPFADTGCPAGQACAARPPGAPSTIDGLCVSLEGSTFDFRDIETPTTTVDEPVTGSAETKPFQSITPELGVDIPGLKLSPAERVGDEVVVPFLAQYINALYRYAIGIVLVASIVMVVWGGFRYLVGSSYGDVARGKEIIRDALAGMLIVIGAYLILQTVNPATTNLSVLRLSFVAEQEIILRTTTAETGGTEGVETGGPLPSAPAGGTGSTKTGAPRAATYTSCPVALTQAAASPFRPSDPRLTEFVEKIQRVVTGSKTRKVIAIAEAAEKCGLEMGSCGNTAETVYRAAGVTDRNNHGRSIKTVGTANIRYLQELTRNCRVNDNSTECKRAARESAAERFRQIDNWPRSFTDILEPGDFINVFTVWTNDRSPNGAGQHSAIFFGWESDGRARLFNGSWGNRVSYSIYCLTDQCRNMYPITNVWRPE
jgi:hypothetical protein